MVSDEFEQIVAQYYRPLYKFAHSLTRAEADACDLTQQTFYVWATKGYQLRDRSKTKAWLFTTLHRVFLETRRQRTRFPHYGLDEADLDDTPGISTDPVNEADCPDVLIALEKVDKIYQATVALFYLEDCSYNQIAEILAVPVGTVKSRLARGILQLRRILGISKSEPIPSSAKVQTDGQVSSHDADGNKVVAESSS